MRKPQVLKPQTHTDVCASRGPTLDLQGSWPLFRETTEEEKLEALILG